MRSFPSATRQRAAACLALLTCAVGLTVPLAHADEDDLQQRRREVENRIDHAADELAEASRGASRATRALQRAQGRLDRARGELGDVRARVATARERDAELRAELVRAELELDEANAALAAGQEAVDEQRSVVRAHVIGVYTQGDLRLRALGSFLDSSSLSDISDQVLADQVVNSKETTVFADLETIEAELADEQAEVERTAQVVEDKRLEAADHLADMQVLYAETNRVRLRVEGLVADARAARTTAYRARERDRRVLQALKEREDRIHDRLVRLAQRQRSQRGYTGDSSGFLSYPLHGYVTSGYGYRTHPIYGYYGLHNGTDFGASGGCGTPLLAAAGGTVIDTYYDSVYGNRLYLAVGNVNGRNLVLIYNHLAGYRVDEGDRVGRGDVVGAMGSTGWSTGCHLHFTVMADGVAVDPMNYL